MPYLTLISRTAFGLSIRGIQAFFSLLVLALAAAAINKFDRGGAISFMEATSVISLIYTLIVITLALTTTNALLSGVFLIFDGILTLFWFSAFIAVAAVEGPINCNAGFDVGFTIWTYNKGACGAGKASIAFGALNWVLFLFTTLVIGFTAVRPLLNDKRNVFAPESVLGKGSITLGTPYVAKSQKDLESNPSYTNGAVETEPKIVEDVDDIPNDNAATLQESSLEHQTRA